MGKNYKSIRIDEEVKNLLDDLEISSGGVPLDTYDSKIRHLVWFYRNYYNNNKM